MDIPSNGRHDILTHRILVVSLGISVVTTIGCIAGLAAPGIDIPPSLPAIGGTALGALTGMLAAIMRNNR